MSTPYMNLTLPSPSVSLGPAWATSLNTAITSIDSHNHTTGQGVQIPTSGININLDLPFNSFNATQLRSSRFVSQGSPLALGSDLNCVYVSGGNLYYNNGSGQQVQITSGSGLSASSVGGISGLTSTTASASYNSGTQTFTWWQNTNKAAIMDVGSVVIHDPSGTSTNGVTIQSPVGLSPGYSLTLPTALPGQTSLVTLSATGVLASSSGLTIDATSNLTHSASSWTMGTSDAQSLILKTNATNRWQIDSSGVLTNLSTGTLAMNAQKITGVADPSAAQDVATKAYVDVTRHIGYMRLNSTPVNLPNSAAAQKFSGFELSKAVGSSVSVDTSTDKFTINDNGTYRIYAHVMTWNGNPTTYTPYFAISLYKNGSNLFALDQVGNGTSNTNNYYSLSGEYVVDLVATDYIELYYTGATYTGGTAPQILAAQMTVDRVG